MRHLKAGRRLGRTTEHRLAMLRNLVTALLDKERVETTRAKACLLYTSDAADE